MMHQPSHLFIFYQTVRSQKSPGILPVTHAPPPCAKWHSYMCTLSMGSRQSHRTYLGNDWVLDLCYCLVVDALHRPGEGQGRKVEEFVRRGS